MNIALACPNWVGDAVMATPAIRALRQRFPDAKICLVVNPYVKDVLEPNPWDTRTVLFPKGGLWQTARALKREKCDVGVLLTNSFRSALLFWLGGVGRRVGYARDFRSPLLTDKLQPAKDGRRFLPVPQIDYYLTLAGAIGARTDNRKMELFTSEADERAAEGLFSRLGLSPHQTLLLAPGSSFGPSKLWPAERMAQVADDAREKWGLQPAILCSSAEGELAEAIRRAARGPVVSFHSLGLGLGVVKAIVRRGRIMVSTDSGLRHFAIAFGLPVVTLFGSTDPRWTEPSYDREAVLQGQVPCGPCQKPVCPTGTAECMLKIQPKDVLEAIAKLL